MWAAVQTKEDSVGCSRVMKALLRWSSILHLVLYLLVGWGWTKVGPQYLWVRNSKAHLDKHYESLKKGSRDKAHWSARLLAWKWGELTALQHHPSWAVTALTGTVHRHSQLGYLLYKETRPENQKGREGIGKLTEEKLFIIWPGRKYPEKGCVTGDGIHYLLIESCLPVTFDINTIYLTKLLLFEKDNDKELTDMHTFNFDDYYLYVIYYPQCKAQLEGSQGGSQFPEAKFLFCFVFPNDVFIESWDDSLLLMFH